MNKKVSIPVLAISILLTSALWFLRWHKSAAREEVQEAKVEIIGAEKVRKEIARLSAQIITMPENPALYFNRSQLFRTLGNKDSSYLDLYKYIYLQPQDTSSYLLGVKYYMEDNDTRSALALLDDAIKQMPASRELLTEQGKIYFYVKKYDNARERFNKAALLSPPYALAFFYNGLLAREEQKLPESITLMEKALNIDPDMYDAKMLLGKWLADTKPLRAEDYLRSAIAQDTTRTEAVYALAMICQGQKKFEEAKDWYKQLLTRDYQYRDAYFNLGYIYLQQDSLEKAIKHFDLAISVSPAYAEAFYMRGLCKEQLGNTEAALVEFKQALVFKEDYELAMQGIKRVEKK